MKMGFIPSVDGAGIICHMCGSVLPGAWKGLIVIRNGRNGVRMCDACLEARDAAIIERAASLGISPERLLELKTMSYKKYLWTPEWEMTRLLALNRADFKCQYCGYKDKLQVHHFSYATRGCERDEDLIVLCNNCHELNHGLHRYNWDHRPFHVRMGIANVV